MPETRLLLERVMERVELRQFTLEGFYITWTVGPQAPEPAHPSRGAGHLGLALAASDSSGSSDPSPSRPISPRAPSWGRGPPPARP